MSDPVTDPSNDPATTAAKRDAQAPHDADRPPTPDEETAAPTEVDPAVAEDYREATERGAKVRGEGQISSDPSS
ncbi:MAG TPA: hypothetical protein VMY34_03825 [Acidimicrobiales bacterium]|nr:hypothetical protein [Acidimicrobiales bacterium]